MLTREYIDQYYRIKNIVQRSENYVPRDYQTIGGKWTTETYKKGDVTLQIMDEGYSARLFTKTNEFDIHETYRNDGTLFELRSGTPEDLSALLAVVES